MNAASSAQGTELSVRLALDAARFATVPGLSEEAQRKLTILRHRHHAARSDHTRRGGAARTDHHCEQSTYGAGRGTLRGQPLSGSDIEAEMGTNRNPAELEEMWTSWHNNVGGEMGDDYARMVEIAIAARASWGFADVGALWRSNYDMSPEEFARLTDRLWAEVKPLL